VTASATLVVVEVRVGNHPRRARSARREGVATEFRDMAAFSGGGDAFQGAGPDSGCRPAREDELSGTQQLTATASALEQTIRSSG